MISRKDWNALKPIARKRAVEVVFFNMPEDFQNKMAEEWHHNNDPFHDTLFKSLYWVRPGKELKVVTTFNV